MQKEIIIHIGTHKTGSTSLQAVLKKPRKKLRDQGAEFYMGIRNPSCHVELTLATLRDGVESFETLKYGRPSIEHTEKLKRYIRSFLDISPSNRIIFSCESLSLLRTKEECIALRDLFGDSCIFKIILVLRDKREFLESYKEQILKVKGRSFSSDYNSSLYVEEDTWLTDYHEIEKCFSEVFEDVCVIDYEPYNIVPKVLSAMDINLPENDTKVYKNKKKIKSHSILKTNPYLYTVSRKVYHFITRKP